MLGEEISRIIQEQVMLVFFLDGNTINDGALFDSSQMALFPPVPVSAENVRKEVRGAYSRAKEHERILEQNQISRFIAVLPVVLFAFRLC